MTEHTSTPWFVVQNGEQIDIHADDYREKREWTVASDVRANDAAFIVRACNAYDDLVAACEGCLYALDLSIEGEGPSSKTAVKCVRDALAKARGEAVTQ